MSHGDNRRVRLEVGDYTSGGAYGVEEEEEQGFTFTATITMEVMDTSRENAKAWFEDHLADIIDQRYQLDVVIEDA